MSRPSANKDRNRLFTMAMWGKVNRKLERAMALVESLKMEIPDDQSDVKNAINASIDEAKLRISDAQKWWRDYTTFEEAGPNYRRQNANV